MREEIFTDLAKVNSAKGIQHWRLAPNRQKRYTAEELVYIKDRVRTLRRCGRDVYFMSRAIASEIGRSIEGVRWQLKHTPGLLPDSDATQMSVFELKTVGKGGKTWG